MKLVEDFKKFALRGNLVDMAIGFTVGAAFTTIARSLVDDIIMPPLGLLIGRADFSDLYVVLRPGDTEAPPYNTLAQAQAAGAVTLNYGLFINAMLTFVLVAIAMFMMIRFVNRLDEQLEQRFGEEKPASDEPASKKCPYCLETIAYKATRCGHCTSDLKNAHEDPTVG